MGMFLILLGLFICFGIYKSRSGSQENYRKQGNREMVCPECGVTYNKEHEINYIENNSMCYHCLAIFDEDLREMNRRSDRDDVRGGTFQSLHNPSHDWEDRDDIDEDHDFYNEEEEESERNYGWEDDGDDFDDDGDDDWDD